jgi:hypothetical protein
VPSNSQAKKALENLRDRLPKGLGKEQVAKVIEEPYVAATAALMIATRMGASGEWDDPSSYLEVFAKELAGWGGFLPLSDGQHAAELEAYRQIADAVRIDYEED